MPAIMKNEIGAIWHSAEGKPWRAKFREIQMKSGFVPTEPEFSQDLPEAKDAPQLALAQAMANITELQALIANLKQENGDLKVKLVKVADSYERMERSYGLSAAKVIAMMPATFGNSHSPIDTFNEMPDGPEKTRFYQEHQAALTQFINQPKPR